MAGKARTSDSPAEPSLFEDHASRVITRLRRALEAVVASVPDTSTRAVDLAAALDIDTKLAWRIGRVVHDADVFNAARFVPGANGFKIVLRAAQRRGASKGAIASAEAAFGSFSELVHTHAGNRRAFDMMLAAHARADRTRVDIEHRRQMFEGSSYVWGVQARVLLRLDILAPSADPLMFDLASVRSFVDLRRLRRDVPWRIARGYSVDDTDVTRVEFHREPLDVYEDAGAGLEGLPLLRAFCSRPLPVCRRVDGPRGAVEYELVEGAVGNTGILTCATGELIRELEPRFRTTGYHEIAQAFQLRTPSEVVVFDVLIHRELFGRPIEPRLFVCSDLFSERIAPRYRDADFLPVQEEVRYLGMGPDVLALPDVPRHVELARFALERCGFDGAQFDAYRVQMKYPPIPATMVIKHDLPDRPDAPSGVRVL